MKRNIKKIFAVFGIVCLAFLSISQLSYAQTPTTAAGTTTSQQDKLANLKIRATGEIDRRVTALNILITKLTNMKRLTTDQKTSFSTQIQTEINNLTTLKTKINADTDLATLRTDVQSIVNAYRVFALFMPQIDILAAADKMLIAIDQVTPLMTKLQTRIQEAQTKGANVTALQAALTEIRNKLADAKIQANNAITTVTPLAPTGYPGNKTTLQSARTMLQTAVQDLKTVRKDAETTIQGLRALNKTTPIPTK